MSGMRILIIEDEQKMARLLKKGLEEENHSTLHLRTLLPCGQGQLTRIRNRPRLVDCALDCRCPSRLYSRRKCDGPGIEFRSPHFGLELMRKKRNMPAIGQ